MNKFFILITFLMLIYLIAADNNCPVGNNCVPIVQCQQINELLKGELNDEERAIIINSKCGIEFKNGYQIIYVCCPVPLPKLSECGHYLFGKTLITSETKIDEFPWTVLLKKDNIFDNYTCEGSLINKRYILTAAHCVVNINIKNEKQLINITTVRLGEWNKKTIIDCQDDVCSLPVDINIEKIIPHPEYEPNLISGHHDIALLRLSNDVNYTKYIQPICLPLQDNLKNNTFNNDTFDVVGWGNRMTGKSDDIKLKTRVNILEHTKCARILYQFLGVNILNSQICSIDTCKGDYGGPLIGLNIENPFDPRHFLAGIISYRPTPCGHNNRTLSTVYTRVGAYIDWILNNLEN